MMYEKVREKVSKEEFEEKVKEIKEHFSGLIEDSTAELLAAYFFGYTPETEISEVLRRGGVATVSGTVEKVFPVRKFKKGDKERKVASLMLKGDVVVRVNLWNDAATLVECGDIFEGVKLKMHCYAKNGELHVSSAGDVDIEVSFTEIAKLVPGERVNIRGRISGIGDPARANEIYVSDSSGRVRVVLWDDKKDLYFKVDIGDTVEILNCSVRISRDGEIEVHAGRNSRVKLCE